MISQSAKPHSESERRDNLGELKPAACKCTAMISQNTRAAMIRNDQPKHESKQCSATISMKPQSTWSPCQLMGTPAYYVTQERRPLASIVLRLTLPKLHLATLYTPGLEINVCKLAKCEGFFRFASSKNIHWQTFASKHFSDRTLSKKEK